MVMIDKSLERRSGAVSVDSAVLGVDVSVGGKIQAVILAGGTGSRLSPLVDHCTRSLLPIANRPLLFYTLQTLEQAGFQSAILIVNKSSTTSISRYLTETYPLDANKYQHKVLDVKLATVSDGIGTADALREVSHLILSDFLLVSSDLLCNFSLSRVLIQHFVTDAAVTLLVAETRSTGKESTVDDEIARDYFGIDDSKQHSRVVLMQAAADIEGKLVIPKETLRHSPSFKIHRDLTDAHAYVFAHWTLSLLSQKRSLSSIKSEFVPFLIEHQFLLGNLCNSYSTKSEELSSALSAKLSIIGNQTVIPIQVSEPSFSAKLMWNEHPNQSGGAAPTDRIFCSICIAPPSAYVSRVKTLTGFANANREIAAGVLGDVNSGILVGNSSKSGNEKGNAAIRSHVSGDSVVGDGVRLGEKSSVKKSVVGDHCVIGNGVKLNGCVIMDHVNIGDGSNLTNCIVCSSADIQQKVSLKDCQVAFAVTVQSQTDAQNELFVQINSDSDDQDTIFF